MTTKLLYLYSVCCFMKSLPFTVYLKSLQIAVYYWTITYMGGRKNNILAISYGILVFSLCYFLYYIVSVISINRSFYCLSIWQLMKKICNLRHRSKALSTQSLYYLHFKCIILCKVCNNHAKLVTEMVDSSCQRGRQEGLVTFFLFEVYCPVTII